LEFIPPVDDVEILSNVDSREDSEAVEFVDEVRLGRIASMLNFGLSPLSLRLWLISIVQIIYASGIRGTGCVMPLLHSPVRFCRWVWELNVIADARGSQK